MRFDHGPTALGPPAHPTIYVADVGETLFLQCLSHSTRAALGMANQQNRLVRLLGDLGHALRHLTGGQQEHALRYAGSVLLRLTDVAASLLKSGNFAFPQVDARMQCDFLQRVFKQRAC